MQILFPFSPNLFYRNIDESQAYLFNAGVVESFKSHRSYHYEQLLRATVTKVKSLNFQLFEKE